MLTADPSELELRIFHALNSDAGPAVDAIARWISSRAFGVAVAALLLAVGVLFVRRVALLPAVAAAIGLSDGIGSQLLKPWFARQRPCYALEPDVVRWIAPAADVGSMPSLHAANFFALAVLAAATHRRLAAPAFALAVAVALSRVYLGVHWPLDVVAGAAWGTVAGGVGVLVLRALDRRGREGEPEGEAAEPREGGGAAAPRDP